MEPQRESFLLTRIHSWNENYTSIMCDLELKGLFVTTAVEAHTDCRSSISPTLPSMQGGLHMQISLFYGVQYDIPALPTLPGPSGHLK